MTLQNLKSPVAKTQIIKCVISRREICSLYNFYRLVDYAYFIIPMTALLKFCPEKESSINDVVIFWDRSLIMGGGGGTTKWEKALVETFQPPPLHT